MTQDAFLKQYDSSQYEKPSVTVDMVVFTLGQYESKDIRKNDERSLRILLIQRGAQPYMGCWALPGGFVHMDESLEEAAYRELKEETNVQEAYLEQLYTFGEVHRDPRLRVISCAYMSLVKEELVSIQAASDAADAKWFDLSYRLIEEYKNLSRRERVYQLVLTHQEIELRLRVKEVTEIIGYRRTNKIEVMDQNVLAFDHGEILARGIMRLRNKVEYEDLAFHLMPEKFSLTDLQKVYEIILDKELLKANFRRKILPMVTQTNEVVTNQGFRPSQLYVYKGYGKEGNVCLD